MTAGAVEGQRLSVLDSLAGAGAGFRSTQVLSEFFVVVTRKIRSPLTDEARERLQNFLQVWPCQGVRFVNPFAADFRIEDCLVVGRRGRRGR